ncbi:MAG: hypothetical protein WBV94_10995 [Blastocatellia bacterium]
MRRKRKTEYNLEIEQTFVVRRSGDCPSMWCSECAESVHMITVDEAAVLCSVTSRTIYEDTQRGKLHFTETPEGFLLICSKSLFR